MTPCYLVQVVIFGRFWRAVVVCGEEGGHPMDRNTGEILGLVGLGGSLLLHHAPLQRMRRRLSSGAPAQPDMPGALRGTHGALPTVGRAALNYLFPADAWVPSCPPWVPCL